MRPGRVFGAGESARASHRRRPETTIEEDAVNATAQFQDRLNQVAKDTESLLDRLLGPSAARGELGRPPAPA